VLRDSQLQHSNTPPDTLHIVWFVLRVSAEVWLFVSCSSVCPPVTAQRLVPNGSIMAPLCLYCSKLPRVLCYVEGMTNRCSIAKLDKKMLISRILITAWLLYQHIASPVSRYEGTDCVLHCNQKGRLCWPVGKVWQQCNSLCSSRCTLAVPLLPPPPPTPQGIVTLLCCYVVMSRCHVVLSRYVLMLSGCHVVMSRHVTL